MNVLGANTSYINYEIDPTSQAPEQMHETVQTSGDVKL